MAPNSVSKTSVTRVSPAIATLLKAVYLSGLSFVKLIPHRCSEDIQYVSLSSSLTIKHIPSFINCYRLQPEQNHGDLPLNLTITEHRINNYSRHECAASMSSTGACDQTINGSDT